VALLPRELSARPKSGGAGDAPPDVRVWPLWLTALFVLAACSGAWSVLILTIQRLVGI